AEPSTYPIPTRDDLLLKMIFWNTARHEDRAGLAVQLRERQKQTREFLDYITAWPKNGYSYIDEFGMLIFDYFYARLEGELAWLDRAIAQIEGPSRGPAQDPRGWAAQQQERRARALGHVDQGSPPAAAAENEH